MADKWTPGPWRFAYGDSFDHGEDGEANGFEVLLGSADPRATGRCRSIDRLRYAEDIFPEDKEYGEAEANAYLIAAAPELYSALREILAANNAYDESEAADQRIALALARGLQVLEKARG